MRLKNYLKINYEIKSFNFRCFWDGRASFSQRIGKRQKYKITQTNEKWSKLSKLYDGLDLIDSNEDGLKRAVELYTVLQGAKEVFIRKLENAERFVTYMKTEDGFQITAPEGYVAIDEGNNAIKLVDRLEFSKANFNVSKNWVSGDEK